MAVETMTATARRVAATFIFIIAALTLFSAVPRPAFAAVPHTPPKPPATTQATRDLAAYRWALTQAGKWYQYGSTGPSTYDCSGLVYAAYRHEHLTLPRDTYEMLAAIGRDFTVTTHPHPGDLAFFGTGHVEFYAGGHRTFGAHSTSERISYRTWNAYWHPTLFLRVVR